MLSPPACLGDHCPLASFPLRLPNEGRAQSGFQCAEVRGTCQRGFLPARSGLSSVGLGKHLCRNTPVWRCCLHFPASSSTFPHPPFLHVMCPFPTPTSGTTFLLCARGTEEDGQELFWSFCPTQSRITSSQLCRTPVPLSHHHSAAENAFKKDKAVGVGGLGK